MSSPFTVRDAGAADLPAMARLAGELARQHHAFDPPRFMVPEDVERGYERWFRHELGDVDAVLVVAAGAGGEIVGYAYGRLEPRDWNALREACGALHDIFVAPSARRGGVGRALLAEAVRRLEAKGAPRVVLMTAWANEPAHRLFEAMGFRRTMIEMTRERG